MSPAIADSPQTVLRRTKGFSLVELLVVIGIIFLLAAFIVPALAPSSARALDNSVHLFRADIRAAQSLARTERTRVRLIIPAEPVAGHQDLSLRAYTTASLDRTSGQWRQREKWKRLPASLAFNPSTAVFAPRKTVVTALGSLNVTGPYLEILANGSTSLDPAAPEEEVQILAAEVSAGSGQATLTPRPNAPSATIAVDPLTGAVTLR